MIEQDTDTLKQVAKDNGYVVEVIAEGEHYDFLARITKQDRWYMPQLQFA